MRESIYLSFNKSSDWDKGIGSLVDWRNGAIRLSSQKNYILETVINLQDYNVSTNVKMIVSNAGMIYLIEKDGSLYGLDWHLKQIDLIDQNIGLADDAFNTTHCFAANNRIYCFNWAQNKVDVRIYSLLNRQWIRKYTIETLETIQAVCLNERLIGVIDQQRRLLWYGANNGVQKGSQQLNDAQLPNVKDLIGIHILGAELQVIYKNNRMRFIRLTTDPIVVKERKLEREIDKFSGGLNFAIAWGTIKDTTYIWTGDEIRQLDIAAKKIVVDDCDHIYALTENNHINIYNDRLVHETGHQQKVARGVYYFPVIDSKVDSNHWHRMILNGEFPEKSHINSRYVAFDVEKLAPHLRKTAREMVEKNEQTFESLEELFSQLEYKEIDNSDDYLFQESYGRYLLIRLEFIGSRDVSPVLERVRIYINRETYSQYLPEIYQTGGHKDFIERFLSIFESMNLEIEDQIDRMSRNFNPSIASDEFLRWMITWMDFSVDESWSTEQLRKLIQLMPALNRKRGTIWAIRQLLELFLEAEIIIVENSKILGDTTENTEEIVEITRRHYGSSPYGFTVLCYRKGRLSDKEREGIKVILDQETPPYCQYKFIELEQGLFLDKHTYLGVNTYLSDYSNFILDNETLLPFNTLLLEE